MFSQRQWLLVIQQRRLLNFVKQTGVTKALDKREYFSLKPYVATPHPSRLIKTIQMRGYNIMFLCRINKNYPFLSPNTPSYQSSGHRSCFRFVKIAEINSPLFMVVVITVETVLNKLQQQQMHF